MILFASSAIDVPFCFVIVVIELCLYLTFWAIPGRLCTRRNKQSRYSTPEGLGQDQIISALSEGTQQRLPSPSSIYSHSPRFSTRENVSPAWSGSLKLSS